ncbi:MULTISPECIES: hypothetical protein [Paenochrobactrum]|uniref:hypothetical protein n=1 Tax=Paenochrobactrum pullorum TaxID=1324351 RepID=UPI0035BC7E3F
MKTELKFKFPDCVLNMQPLRSGNINALVRTTNEHERHYQSGIMSDAEIIFISTDIKPFCHPARKRKSTSHWLTVVFFFLAACALNINRLFYKECLFKIDCVEDVKK